jgi:hypothetical protein
MFEWGFESRVVDFLFRMGNMRVNIGTHILHGRKPSKKEKGVEKM